jgi:asparagine synthase (glutamine-hydrolysing)
MFRFMTLLWNARSPEQSATAETLERQLQLASGGWCAALAARGIRVLVADRSQYLGVCSLCDQAGVVVGEVFARRNDSDNAAPADAAKFNRLETLEALKTEGRSLVRNFWGNFVAFIIDEARGATHVYNDPSGTLPCYYTRHRGLQLVFSSLSDCRELGLKPQVNWAFVRARAVNGLLDLDTPSLLGVSTIHRGECARFDAQGEFVSKLVYWHPTKFEGASDLIVNPGAAAKSMRATVSSCVHSLTAHHSSLLAQTSGGLDSSVVLGCLGEAPNKPRITCYTDYVRDSVCDERRWARYASQRGGYRHVELCRDPRAMIFKELPALAPTMEPACYFTHWQRGPKDRALAEEFDATVVFSGDGGDSSFCSTSFIYAVDHSLKRHGIGLRTLRTALRVASRRDRTVWSVLATSLGRVMLGAGRRDEGRRRSALSSLVSTDAKEFVRREQGKGRSSFLRSDGRATQETLLRMGTLAFPPIFYDLSTSAQSRAPYTVSPLSAQPVYELCARIPVDVHFDAGRIRGLARRAFVDVVPAPILRRQWKDRPLLFVPEVIQRNVGYLREVLLDGALVKEGILDQAQLGAALQTGPTRSAAIGAEIVNHLDLELWIRDCRG